MKVIYHILVTEDEEKYMDNLVDNKTAAHTRRARHAVKSQQKRKINISRPNKMTDDEWNSGMKRMSDVIGKAFSNVDVDEYVNSFRR